MNVVDRSGPVRPRVLPLDALPDANRSAVIGLRNIQIRVRTAALVQRLALRSAE